MKFEDFIQEGKKITLKRQYTENHPAITAGKSARVRNKMLEAVADGKITQEEFDNILKEYSSNSSKWMKRNAKFFNVSEEGISLTSFGKKALSAISINEEEPVEEGRKFVAAARKAKNEGKEDFEFEGKKYPVTIKESVGLFEATVDMDAMDHDSKGLAKLLKKHKVKMEILDMNGPSGYPEVRLTGKRKDLEAVLADDEYGWDDPDLAEYIEEGNAFGAARAKAIADGEDTFEVDGETYPVEDVDKEDKENAEEFTGESFIIESFSKFVESLNEGEMLTEAFKSMKLAQLLTPKKKTSWNKGIAQEFYNYTKVKMDKIEDHDLLEVDPRVAYKQKGGTKVKFFLIDNEKQSPYTEDTYDGRIPAGLIAVLDGNNNFMGAVYKRFSSDKGRVLTKTNKGDSIGVDKRRKGYGATGLSSAKKIADFADRAIVIDIDILRQRYSAEQQRDERAAAQKGAVAFKSDKDFKAENMARYREILANKAATLPLDKMVNDAIDKIAAQIKEGLAKGEKTNYGEIKIGENKRGSAVKMRDAANHMQNILDNYDRYVNYITQAEQEKAEWGKENSFYARESKTYAKEVKDKINQIDNFDYAW